MVDDQEDRSRAGRHLSRPLSFALSLWIAACVAASVRTLLKPESHTVFPILSAAVDHWWADRSLYDDYAPLDYFRYPPPLAVFLSPIAWLGLRAGGVVWAWINFAVYGAGLWTFARRVLPVEWSDVRLAVYLCLALFGGLRGLWNGQSNALIVGLLLLGTVALMDRRWWVTSFLFAGAMTIKPTAIAPILLLCALWPLRLTPRLVVALAVFAAVPFLTRPPDVVVRSYGEWARHMAETASVRWDGFRDGYTVWQVAREYLSGDPKVPWLKEPLDSPAYRILQALTAFAALLWTLRLRNRGMGERGLVTRTFAIGVAWTLVFGPASEHPTYVFIAPVLCWAILEPGLGWARRISIGAAFALVMFLGWSGVTQPLQAAFPIVLTALPVGTAIFIGWLAASSPAEISRSNV